MHVYLKRNNYELLLEPRVLVLPILQLCSFFDVLINLPVYSVKPNFPQKQQLEVFSKIRCSLKFLKIHWKTSVPEPLF